MRTILIAACVACLVGGGAPAPAMAQTASARDKAVAGQLQRWLAEVVAWSKPAETVTDEQAALLGALQEGAVTVFNYIEQDNLSEAGTWSAAWAAEQRARHAALQASAKALRGRPLPPTPAGLDQIPAVKARLRELEKLGDRVAAAVEKDQAMVDEVIALVEQTAKGDMANVRTLGVRSVQLNIAMMEGENTRMRAMRNAAVNDQPQAPFIDAQLHANQAMIEVLGLSVRSLEQKPSDRAAIAAAVRGHAAALVAASREMERLAQAQSRSIESEPALAATPLGRTLKAALATYAESAAIEREIAAFLEKVAVRLEDKGVDDTDVVPDGLDVVLQRRLDVDARRRAFLAG